MDLKIFRKQKGQTLIEVVVAIALALIIITALVSLTSRTNQNANSSKIAEVAAKFAQEGQEAVRQIKLNDGDIRNSGVAGVSKWSDLYKAGVAGTLNPLRLDLVQPLGTHGGTLTPACGAVVWCLDGASLGTAEAGSTTAPGTGGIVVSRQVEIYDIAGASGVNGCFQNSGSGGAVPLPGFTAPLVLNANEVKSVLVLVTWTDQSGTHKITLYDCVTSRI
ncbi:MAG: type II secretion system protein [bacterium]|nr:type II secretion system protein [bacterium]